MKSVIVCCGNPLAGDDGFGPYIFEQLRLKNLDGDVELIDAGTGGLDILTCIENAGKAIIVDSVCSGKKAGTVQLFEYNAGNELPGVQFSLHEMGLMDVLKNGEAVMPDSMPGEIVIIGVEIERNEEFSIGLTPEVEKAVPDVIEMVMRELENV